MGLQQFGIDAVIAPSFGEIVYSNAINNRLLAVMLEPDDVQALLDEAATSAAPLDLAIDVAALLVTSSRHRFGFTLSPRHQRMMLDGLDLIGASLQHRRAIEAFAQRHWEAQPWTRDVARHTCDRLAATMASTNRPQTRQAGS